MATANLVLRFIVEVLGIAALAYAGFRSPGNALVKTAARTRQPSVFAFGGGSGVFEAVAR